MPGFFSQPKKTLKNDLLSLLVPVSMVASRINASLYEKLISNFEISRMNIFYLDPTKSGLWTPINFLRIRIQLVFLTRNHIQLFRTTV